MTYFEIEPMLNPGSFEPDMDTYLSDFPARNNETEYSLNPKIDISEDEKNFYLEIEIPGANKEDLKVTMSGNQLVVNGETMDTKNEIPGRRIISSDRKFGKFSRTFTINSEIMRDSLEAKYNKGILRISIGKLVPEKNERIIEIK